LLLNQYGEGIISEQGEGEKRLVKRKNVRGKRFFGFAKYASLRAGAGKGRF